MSTSTARHHTEWLSLLEISGPFLSLPVLLRVFPQGVDAHDSGLSAALRGVYDEWLDQQQGLHADPTIHRAWVRWVVDQVLGMPPDVVRGASSEQTMERWSVTVAEYGETLTPDLVIVEPPDPFAAAPEMGETARLLIFILPPGQELERPLAGAVWKASPATRMMTLLHATGVRLGLVTNGEGWMLVNAKAGEATGFVSWYSELWLDEPLTLRALRTLLGAARFFAAAQDETLEALLDASVQDQQEVTDQLGSQVRHAVELLVQALDRADQDAGRSLLAGVGETALYETAVTLMMRLVFLLTAEERGLLPLDDEFYARHYAVSTLAEQLREMADQHGEEVLERRNDAWPRLLALFRAVHQGVQHDRLRLPAYGGSLFDPARYPFLEGAPPPRPRPSPVPGEGAPPPRPSPSTGSGHRPVPGEGVRRAQPATHNSQPITRNSPLLINNRVILHLLEALQFLQVDVPGGERQRRRLSFRALDIEQIGHVYEGLLDHTALRAETPVLGLAGTREKEPEIPLPVLEGFLTRPDGGQQTAERGRAGAVGGPSSAVADERGLLAFLREQTGRSENALRTGLHAPPPDLWRIQTLRTACNNDEELLRRVLPWQGLIRDDDYGRPVVIPAGSVYVTVGEDRRSSGAHYTPRSLTEPIVQHTLEPLVYHGPAEGKPREQWRLRRPAEILALKVCDMAMGSAAFLVQSCRYISERLVESLEEYGSRGGAKTQRNEENLRVLAASRDAFALLTAAETDEERLVLARRLVADRCLYGVDKNPLAVEMAKLSLWLITMDKGKPFTFLDHSLKCGDSLLGVDLAQLSHWSLHPDGSPELFTLGLLLDSEKLVALRLEIEEMPVLDVRDQEAKRYKLAQADALAHDLKSAADLLVGSYYNSLGRREQESLRGALLLAARDGADVAEQWRQHADLGGLRPFHWPLEFPEVFLPAPVDKGGEIPTPRGGEAAGFDAFVGNPPFIGGKRIRDTLGDYYRNILNSHYTKSNGNADLSAFFFLRCFSNLRKNGTLGLIATNTIAQGDTRLGGLEPIINSGGKIYRALNNMPWPGTAAVVVSVVHIAKSDSKLACYLDGEPVQYISSQLDRHETLGNPYPLAKNKGKSFVGSFVNGMGFVLEPEEAEALLAKDPRNSNVIFPYLNGQDLNSHPEQQPSRWVINFFDWPRERTGRGSWDALDEKQQQKMQRDGVVPVDYPGPVAADYPDCYQILQERVYPERMKVNREAHKKYWWHYGDKRPALYREVRNLRHFYAISRVTKYVAISVIRTQMVLSEATVVFALESFAYFSLLQSTIHAVWVDSYTSSMGQTYRYSPSDVFETFPLPESIFSILQLQGAAYHEHRSGVMTARQEGLTSTYNRFHDPGESSAEIARLRELHVAMDNAVAGTYGWGDLVLGHSFHATAQGVRFTIHDEARRAVLTRLLALNHRRYAEEVAAGLHEGKKGKAKGNRRRPEPVEGKRQKGNAEDEGQLGLL